MELLKKYSYLFPLLINILVPVVGILVFHWSILDLFFYFFLELLFVGGLTLLKIISASGFSKFGNKIWVIIGFLIKYTLLFLLILIIAGNFFDGTKFGGEQIHFSRESFGLLIATYLFAFFSFIFSGEYKRFLPADAAGETYRRMGVIVLILFVTLLLMRLFVHHDAVNYVLGIALILTKNLVEFFALHWMHKSKINLNS